MQGFNKYIESDTRTNVTLWQFTQETLIQCKILSVTLILNRNR